jgi:dGTPase
LAAVMAPYGGFDHNAQSLRVVVKLEQRHAAFDGLNLTWETLEGLAKHNGPLCAKGQEASLPAALVEYNARHDLELYTYASMEAQVAALADDIAYNNHDIDDGLRAGLFTLDDLRQVPMVDGLLARIEARYPGLALDRLISELVRALIGDMVEDILAETGRRLLALNPKSVTEIRLASRAVVAFSEKMATNDKELKSFLMKHMYRHYKVNRMASKARRVVRDLFNFYLSEPECLPTEWRVRAEAVDEMKKARLIADFIAGMTDRYALLEYRKLFDETTLEI